MLHACTDAAAATMPTATRVAAGRRGAQPPPRLPAVPVAPRGRSASLPPSGCARRPPPSPFDGVLGRPVFPLVCVFINLSILGVCSYGFGVHVQGVRIVVHCLML